MEKVAAKEQAPPGERQQAGDAKRRHSDPHDVESGEARADPATASAGGNRKPGGGDQRRCRSQIILRSYEIRDIVLGSDDPPLTSPRARRKPSLRRSASERAKLRALVLDDGTTGDKRDGDENDGCDKNAS